MASSHLAGKLVVLGRGVRVPMLMLPAATASLKTCAAKLNVHVLIDPAGGGQEPTVNNSNTPASGIPAGKCRTSMHACYATSCPWNVEFEVGCMGVRSDQFQLTAVRGTMLCVLVN